MFGPNIFPYRFSYFNRSSIKSLTPSDIQKGFIKRDRFNERGISMKNLHDLVTSRCVICMVTWKKNCFRAKLLCAKGWHSRMNPKRTCLIRGSSHYSTISRTTYYYRFTDKFWPSHKFSRDKESIHVNMHDVRSWNFFTHIRRFFGVPSLRRPYSSLSLGHTLLRVYAFFRCH